MDVIYQFLKLPATTTFYQKFLLTKSKQHGILVESVKDGVQHIRNIEAFDVEDTFLETKQPDVEEKVSRKVNRVTPSIGANRFVHLHVFEEIQGKIRVAREEETNKCTRMHETARKR